MKIYHGPKNTAGIAGVLSKAERSLGMDSNSICLDYHNFSFFADRSIKVKNLVRAIIQWSIFLITESWKFDVYVFYYNFSLTGSLLFDIPLLRKMRKKVFFYFHGCDLRERRAVMAKYPINACRNCPVKCSPVREKALAMARRYANGIFVSTPDLLEFAPGSLYIPQAVDLGELNAKNEVLLQSRIIKAKRDDKQMLVVHSPTDRILKGTYYLVKAIEGLQKDGFPIVLQLIENVPHEKALAMYAQADVAVDQLLIGSYGTFSIEMMYLEKPVICYIREDIRAYYPDDLPILSARPDNIGDVLKWLYYHRKDWEEIGKRGVEYVKSFHDSITIAAKLLNYYRTL